MCRFLSDYSAWLLGCGATCIRLEKNIRRIAHRWNMEVDMYTMPRHIHISVWWHHSADQVAMLTSVVSTPISFEINTRLSELSWAIADRHIDFDKAVEEFKRIVSSRKGDSRWLWVLVAVANAAFCRLFGGDWMAMAVVAVASGIGFYLKTELLRRRVDIRAAVFVCAFVSTVLGATGMLFGLGQTPRIALATCVLYLVPGIPFINSFSDMIYRHYICAFSRFVDAVVLTSCLSAGLCAGLAVMGIGMF